MGWPPGNGLSGLRNQDRSSSAYCAYDRGWLAENRHVADGKPTLRADSRCSAQATWDEVTEEARRRFSNLSRVE